MDNNGEQQVSAYLIFFFTANPTYMNLEQKEHNKKTKKLLLKQKSKWFFNIPESKIFLKDI